MTSKRGRAWRSVVRGLCAASLASAAIDSAPAGASPAPLAIVSAGGITSGAPLAIDLAPAGAPPGSPAADSVRATIRPAAAVHSAAPPTGLIHVPIALARSAPRSGTAVVLPDHDMSAVLYDTPLPVGSDLRLFEDRASAGYAEAAAFYRLPADGPTDLEAWFRSVLPALGWRAEPDADGEMRWRWGDEWLTVRLPSAATADLLVVRRDSKGVRPAGDVTLDGRWPLPPAGTRRRYDPADLFPEEVEVDGPASVVVTRVLELVAADGWRSSTAESIGPATVVRLAREGRSALLAVRPLPSGRAEVAFGDRDCLAARPGNGDDPRPPSAVYLTDVPAPPDASIDRYVQRVDAGEAVETWRAPCLDLDLGTAWLAQAAGAAGWAMTTLRESRGPGTIHVRLEPPAPDLAVEVIATADGRGAVTTEMTRARAGRRRPVDRSLLFGDLPMLADSDAVRLESNTADGWRFRETYLLPRDPGVSAPAAFRRAMAGLGWTFERLAPPGVGPGQVHYLGGEEVLVGFVAEAEDVPAVTLSRRRVCPSDRPAPPPPEGPASPHLSEMHVYPDAVFESFAGAEERYRVECASLDLLVAWYRAAMASGNWSLAATVGPEDAFRRELLFVRPDERGLPPEARTAWAEVQLERIWPYHYGLVLRRDLPGVRPDRALR